MSIILQILHGYLQNELNILVKKIIKTIQTLRVLIFSSESMCVHVGLYVYIFIYCLWCRRDEFFLCTEVVASHSDLHVTGAKSAA